MPREIIFSSDIFGALDGIHEYAFCLGAKMLVGENFVEIIWSIAEETVLLHMDKNKGKARDAQGADVAEKKEQKASISYAIKAMKSHINTP